jgi:hypothetical protein
MDKALDGLLGVAPRDQLEVGKIDLSPERPALT